MSARPSRRTGPEEAREVVRAFLSDDEERAWHGLIEAHDSLTRAVEARLVADHRMPLPTLEALIEMASARGDTKSATKHLGTLRQLRPSSRFLTRRK